MIKMSTLQALSKLYVTSFTVKRFLAPHDELEVQKNA